MPSLNCTHIVGGDGNVSSQAGDKVISLFNLRLLSNLIAKSLETLFPLQWPGSLDHSSNSSSIVTGWTWKLMSRCRTLHKSYTTQQQKRSTR
ncbi:hypothetical protein PsorP6_014617 [Peronosclerospora sorghi]|uniref:Uncharacterized protein n=1 Tax=Peronosclerospora sorghi TaxID=230839 RepID=A0ACC0VSD3_9STRA|nr:hypothetical protein PsorP6_014617 [Peronosclerospora sorghi]